MLPCAEKANKSAYENVAPIEVFHLGTWSQTVKVKMSLMMKAVYLWQLSKINTNLALEVAKVSSLLHDF